MLSMSALVGSGNKDNSRINEDFCFCSLLLFFFVLFFGFFWGGRVAVFFVCFF